MLTIASNFDPISCANVVNPLNAINWTWSNIGLTLVPVNSTTTNAAMLADKYGCGVVGTYQGYQSGAPSQSCTPSVGTLTLTSTTTVACAAGASGKRSDEEEENTGPSIAEVFGMANGFLSSTAGNPLYVNSFNVSQGGFTRLYENDDPTRKAISNYSSAAGSEGRSGDSQRQASTFGIRLGATIRRDSKNPDGERRPEDRR
jgi:hypothetical protein